MITRFISITAVFLLATSALVGCDGAPSGTPVQVTLEVPSPTPAPTTKGPTATPNETPNASPTPSEVPSAEPVETDSPIASPEPSADVGDVAAVTAEYRHDSQLTGETAQIGHSVDFTNLDPERWAVPTVRYVPVDQDGEPVADAKVTPALGSDLGLLAIPPGGLRGDLLIISGPASDSVADVVVSVERLVLIDSPLSMDAANSIGFERLDEDGTLTDEVRRAAAYEYTNTTDVDVLVRTVFINMRQGAENEAPGVYPTGAIVMIDGVIAAGSTERLPVAGAAIDYIRRNENRDQPNLTATVVRPVSPAMP